MPQNCGEAKISYGEEFKITDTVSGLLPGGSGGEELDAPGRCRWRRIPVHEVELGSLPERCAHYTVHRSLTFIQCQIIYFLKFNLQSNHGKITGARDAQYSQAARSKQGCRHSAPVPAAAAGYT